MVSKEPNCLPTTNSHSNGNPEKSATMTVRSVLLNRNSPDIESRLKRRRNRTQQVRFKDLDDGEVPETKPERRSPHPGRKSPTHTPASSWRDEVANGPSLVGSVRGDMESTIGAVEEFLKRAPRHPLTPGPTRRSWAPPRPCSLTLPLPRQPCMSTAIQTSPSLQKPHSLPRSQSLGSSIRAGWDEDEEEDLLIGIVTPMSSSKEMGRAAAELEAAGSAPRRTQANKPHCLCSGEDSAAPSDLGERPCSCPTVAPKSIPGRYRGRRRRITRTASDPGRAESPAVSPARAASPSDRPTSVESPSSSPPQKSPLKSSPTQTDMSVSASHENATSCVQTTANSCDQVTAACTPQETVPTCIAPTTPPSHNRPVPSMPNCVPSPQSSPSSKAVLPLNNDSADLSTSPVQSTFMTPAQKISSAAETLPHCTNLTQSVPACKTPKQPVPSCQTPTQTLKVKTPTQTVPSSIPAAKSVPTPQNNIEITPPSVALTQSLPTCETPRQTIASCETPTQSVKAKTPKQTLPSAIIATTPMPTSQNPMETMPLLITSTQTLPNANTSVKPAPDCTTSQHTTLCKSPTQPMPVSKTPSKPVSVCETPEPICKTPTKAEPAPSQTLAQTIPRSKTPTQMEPSCKTPVQFVPDCITPSQPTQRIPVCMTPTQSCKTTPSLSDCTSPTQPTMYKTPIHITPTTPKSPTNSLSISKTQPVLDCTTYTEMAGPCNTSDNTGPSYPAAAQVMLPCNAITQMPPCISERTQAPSCPSNTQAVPHYFNTTNSVPPCVAPAQIMPPSAPATNTMPACIIPESAVPPYVTQQTIQVCTSPFKMIHPGIMPNQTSSPSICVRQVSLSQTVIPASSQPPCPAAYLPHAAPPYSSSPRASPAPSQAPPYTTQDRKLPPPPPPPPPYTPRKEGATATGQTRRQPTPKAASTEKEKAKEKQKLGNGVLMRQLAAGGHICGKAAGGAEGGVGVGVPCVPPKNTAQAAIKAATMGARRALFCSEAQACASQCPRPRTPCGQQQQSSSAQAEGQADTLRHVQELLGGLMSGARCKLDLTRAKEKLLGPNGPLYDISSLQSQLHSLEGVLETSQNTIKVLLDVIQDLEKKEAERDGRHSYRTGQDIENCGTCRDCACIIYSVEHDFRLQEGQVTRAWKVPEPQESEQGSPQTVLQSPPGRNQDSPQSVKKSRKKCFWFL
ncbi:hypothetical protein AALO_G00171270 [Alosa alosa]|uniref:Uncharacterized protein n=1 Tax=Alosa alosa TaxID=278164 RepID=A0AAV6GCX3_9TELE|nr:proteoglycan 4 [Alosa alosa]KAG5272969.1 hypothetical protein AALO_G00171270 [Alosa alosa]